MTQERLCSLDLNDDKILKLIRSLNVQKVYEYDMSIRMIKICGKSLVKPLIMLFQNSVRSSYYPDIWKKSNIIKLYARKMVNN